MEDQKAFDTTTASLATAKPSRFTIKNLADVDPMTEFREAAAKLAVGQLYEGLSVADATCMARAIAEIHGPRTASTETVDGARRVTRVEPRPERVRKAEAKDAPAKTAAKTAAKKKGA